MYPSPVQIQGMYVSRLQPHLCALESLVATCTHPPRCELNIRLRFP